MVPWNLLPLWLVIKIPWVPDPKFGEKFADEPMDNEV